MYTDITPNDYLLFTSDRVTLSTSYLHLLLVNIKDRFFLPLKDIKRVSTKEFKVSVLPLIINPKDVLISN